MDQALLTALFAIALIGVGCLVFWAWLEGRNANEYVQRLARNEVAAARDLAVLRMAELFDAMGDEISAYWCAGCDCAFFRRLPGHLVMGDGFEFCSIDCHKTPEPFPAPEPSSSAETDHSLN